MNRSVRGRGKTLRMWKNVSGASVSYGGTGRNSIGNGRRHTFYVGAKRVDLRTGVGGTGVGLRGTDCARPFYYYLGDIHLLLGIRDHVFRGRIEFWENKRVLEELCPYKTFMEAGNATMERLITEKGRG